MSVQPEHVMSVQEAQSTFPAAVSVVGKSNYGEPIYKSLTHNSWLSNIGQEFVIANFNYSTNSSQTEPLFQDYIYPVNTNANNATISWFNFFVSNYQSFTCRFDILLEVVKHSAHRGIISMAFTVLKPTAQNLSEQFLPIALYDISGEEEMDYVYSIPSIYAVGSKMFIDSARDITNEKLAVTQRVPQLMNQLGYLTISAIVPLESSAMLPSEITCILKLRPDISTLRTYHPVLGSSNRFTAGQRMPGLWQND
nr:MAG: hypothetical protein [Wufeng shrew polycipivirus 3]